VSDLFAMRTDGVDASAARLGRIGEQLGADWDAAKAAITGFEAVIGAGRLGDAFRLSYTEASQQARANADRMPPLITGLAAAGSTSVKIYDGTEADNTAALRVPGGW
jgi:hypothetical protein